MGMGARLIDAMDAAEQAGNEAEFHADLYFTIQKCRAGQGDESDWKFIEWACGCLPSELPTLPVDMTAPLPF